MLDVAQCQSVLISSAVSFYQMMFELVYNWESYLKNKRANFFETQHSYLSKSQQKLLKCELTLSSSYCSTVLCNAQTTTYMTELKLQTIQLTGETFSKLDINYRMG